MVVEVVVVEKKGKQDLITEQNKMMLDRWLDGLLHKQYPSKTDEKGMWCWRYLPTDYLKKETDSLLMLLQDQTLAANAYKVSIMKNQGC